MNFFSFKIELFFYTKLQNDHHYGTVFNIKQKDVNVSHGYNDQQGRGRSTLKKKTS